MAVDTRQAAGTVTAIRPDIVIAGASRLPMVRTIAFYAAALTLLLLMTAASMGWDGLATYDAGTPGAPLNTADAEQ